MTPLHDAHSARAAIRVCDMNIEVGLLGELGSDLARSAAYVQQALVEPEKRAGGQAGGERMGSNLLEAVFVALETTAF